MLESFTVRNFKSFREAKLELRPLTVLIGANASGKTNLLEALQLLGWMASGRQLPQVLSAIRDEELSLRGTLPQLAREAGAIGFECAIRNRADAPQLRLRVDLGLDESLGPRIVFEQLDECRPHVRRLYSVDEPRSVEPLPIQYDAIERGMDTNLPNEASALQPVFTQLSSSRPMLIPVVTRLVGETLQDILVLDPSPRAMRGYSHQLDRNLRADGANVSAVLHELAARGEGARILEFVRALPEQDITGVDFLATPRGEVMVALEESFGGSKALREAALLSDGTLRALVIAAAILAAKPGSTLVIEEVDNGIHPPRVARMLALMQREAEQRDLRLVVTTHNPALLDAIPDTELAHVVVCYRDPEQGDSRLVRLGDLEAFPALMARASLGELVTRGVLERTLRDPTSSEQRKAHASEWLRKLEGGA